MSGYRYEWKTGKDQSGIFETVTIGGRRYKIHSHGSNHVVWIAFGERARFRTSQRHDNIALPDLKSKIERVASGI
jgi:hypothetical protein